ncbi:MAG: protein kinase [Acidobacteriota bacterium]
MDAERWATLERLFNAAVTRPPETREAYLAEACGEDAELLREVRRLLAADASESRLSRLAASVAHDWLAEGPADDLTGREVGPFVITARLAAGGMGQVYLARDAALERQVAIKVLPLAFARDADRARRFENEARVIAALNHPHIVTILQIGDVDGRRYVATEFIEGETFRAIIARGPAPLPLVIDLCLQVCAALAAAHAAGIVHRDLKPENVMVRPDGYVKVLDFGLAKQRRTALDLSMATLTGAVMGTMDYMSPEQALGQEVDHRTDIFGIGVLAFELLTGTVPFRGRTDADTRAALEHACGGTPTGRAVAAAVNRALAKEPDQRFQSAAELRTALSEAAGLADPPASESRRGHRRRALAAGLAAVVLLGAAAATALVSNRGAAPAVPPDVWRGGLVQQVTDMPGLETTPSLSADGRVLVYAASGPGGDFDIFRLDEGSRVPVLLTPDSPVADLQPAVSPDGRRVAFRSDRDGGGIFVINASGGEPRRVSEVGYHPAWSPDGRSLALSGVSMERPEGVYLLSELWVVDVETTNRRAIATRDAVQPAWSPDGRLIAFARIPDGGGWQRDIWVIPVSGGTAVRVTTDPAADMAPFWGPDGASIWFCSDRGGAMNVWRVPVNPATGRPTGPADPLAVPAAYACPAAVARDAPAVVYVSATARTAIARAGFDAVRGALVTPPQVITPMSRGASSPDVSPDGTRIAFHNEGDRQEDIWVMNLDGSGLTALTRDAASDRMPRWSPDGTRLAFFSNRSGKSEIWTVAPDGSALRQLSTGPEGVNVNVPVYSRDPRRMSVHEGQVTHIIDPTLPYTGQAKDTLPHFSYTGFRFSADLRFLWGWQRVAGGPYPDGIVRYDIARREYVALTDIGTGPFPMADGRRLLFTHIRDLYLLDAETRAYRRIDTGGLSVTQAVLTPDEQTIVMSVRFDESDLWRLTPRAVTAP